MDDIELLREYVTKGSECAFETLVHRHVNLVYSAALRLVHDPTIACEVTQTVFIILARKAHRLHSGVVLSSWLYRTAQFAASKALRTDLRRRQHESEAAQMTSETTDTKWEQIAPFLEAAMAGLGDTDRNAVVLRYFENKNLKEVGLALGTNERAAQKRVARALEKSRALLIRRGTVLSASVLASALSASAVHAAPAGVAAAAAAAGISKGVGIATSTAALIKGTLNLMTWIKLKAAATVAAMVLIATGSTVLVISETSDHDPLYEGKPLTYWLAHFDPLPIPKPATPNKANEAVRHLGTNAIPTLLRMLRSKNVDTSRVVRAFYVLGPLAKPAIPALTELLDNREHRATEAIDILGNEGCYISTSVALEPEVTLPLVKGLTNSIVQVRSIAANRLGHLRIKPEPKLVVPALIRALDDPVPEVRMEATNALKTVSPEAAAKAGITFWNDGGYFHGETHP